MSQQLPNQSNVSTKPVYHLTGANHAESDEAYLTRQFCHSIEALERVGALEPGEFEQLIHMSARSAEEHHNRATHHERIARIALAAAQQGLLLEEEFNLWSGRRKENGEPVKNRFETAYMSSCTPDLSHRRGALTGIVRAYQRLLDELLARLEQAGEEATSAEELLVVERCAVDSGLLEFEPYTQGCMNGWPTFPRSTGQFRGAAHLRVTFEQRQAALTMSPGEAEELLQYLEQRRAYLQTEALGHRAQEPKVNYQTSRDAEGVQLSKLIAGMARRLFHLQGA